MIVLYQVMLLSVSNPLVRCMYMFLTKLQSVYVMVRQEEFQILT
jgi:hypothetical protein